MRPRSNSSIKAEKQMFEKNSYKDQIKAHWKWVVTLPSAD